MITQHPNKALHLLNLFLHSITYFCNSHLAPWRGSTLGLTWRGPWRELHDYKSAMWKYEMLPHLKIQYFLAEGVFQLTPNLQEFY